MAELIKQTNPIARKNYRCMAFGLLLDCDKIEELTFTEKKAIATVYRNGGILKGEAYIKQVCKDGGYVYTFRATPELHAICGKYGMYEE